MKRTRIKNTIVYTVITGRRTRFSRYMATRLTKILEILESM